MFSEPATPSFGVIFHPLFPPESLADYARRAEAAGFDELWLWDDCFLPGAFTSAAIALASTKSIKVCIGLIPVTAYNPLFIAMEITTLARAFPGRILTGFGHGVGFWMKQIGAVPKSSMAALEETFDAVRRLLAGEMVTTHGQQVNLDQVQMHLIPEAVPPLYIGAMRTKTLQLAGRIAEGTILTGNSSPEYVSWAREQVNAAMLESGRGQNRLAVYLDVKVSTDGVAARSGARRAMADRLPWSDVQMNALGILEEVNAFMKAHDREEVARQMPDRWLDSVSASGTPHQAAEIIQRFFTAGADSVVFQPLNGDPDCLDEYARLLMPLFKARK